MKPARTVTSRGVEYKLKPSADPATMPGEEDSIGVSIWLNRNTYPKGYSKAPAQSLPQVQVNA